MEINEKNILDYFYKNQIYNLNKKIESSFTTETVDLKVDQ